MPRLGEGIRATVMLVCHDCKWPVEAVVMNEHDRPPGSVAIRAYAPCADSHEAKHGHYPDRVIVFTRLNSGT